MAAGGCTGKLTYLLASVRRRLQDAVVDHATMFEGRWWNLKYTARSHDVLAAGVTSPQAAGLCD